MKLSFININDVSDREIGEWTAELSEKKRESISRMKQPQKAALRIAADALCRRAVAAETGISPRDVVFGENPYGKPEANGVFFSVSHSGSIAVCAVSERPIGVDTEEIRSIRPEVAKRFACDDELMYIGNSSVRLLEIWTLKEAYFKCIGTGLGTDIKSVSFTVADSGIICSKGGFKCRFEKIADGYICAVCEKNREDDNHAQH